MHKIELKIDSRRDPARYSAALILSVLMSLPLAASSLAAAERGVTVIKDIPYSNFAKGDRRRSLDLYLPAKTERKPPLMIFVHGGFWVLSDDEYKIGPAVAETLAREGVAVALLRYRLAPAVSHTVQFEDVAAGVALAFRQAQRYGYDNSRIFLAGHSAGGHLAAMIALNPSHLRKHNLEPKSLAGVVTFSGLYNLAPTHGVSENQKIATEKTFGKNPLVLNQASPVNHVRANAPPFLILTAQSDFPGFLTDAKQFSDALARAGNARVERWIVPERDHFSLLRLGERDNEARLLLLEFLEAAPLPPEFAILADAKRRWRNSPFSTEPFWRHESLIRSYPVDQRFVARLLPIYTTLRYELQEWPLESFHAIDLFAWLDSLPPEKTGRGDYLTITNIRNEKQFWKRQQIEPYRPVIVIGLDDEKNLFRLGVFYRAHRAYSWKSGPQPPMMARPLGAFIHFLLEPPPEIAIHQSQFALTRDSFRQEPDDPLQPLKELRKDLYQTVTFRNGCIYCHSLGGIGSQSHHVTAAQGKAHGGLALPLESYPPQVWKAFIFDQHTVAKKIGASPNPVAEQSREALFDLVNQWRRQKQKK